MNGIEFKELYDQILIEYNKGQKHVFKHRLDLLLKLDREQQKEQLQPTQNKKELDLIDLKLEISKLIKKPYGEYAKTIQMVELIKRCPGWHNIDIIPDDLLQCFINLPQERINIEWDEEQNFQYFKIL